MNIKKTFGNTVLIKLDKENDVIKLKSGIELFLDTSYEPEKHITVTGEVYGLPKKLQYTGIPNLGMPWKTEMELKPHDKVIVYYLAVANAFRPESYKVVFEGSDRYVSIQYQQIFAKVKQGVVMPINGYCLVEPMEDPNWTREKARILKAGVVPVMLKDKSMKDVVYGKVRYCGIPNQEYVDKHSDEGVGVMPGDVVVMKRITDIPLEYDMHASIDGGKRYWRVQRRNIFAVL